MTTLVKRLARNTVGRDLIVGDIHGHFTLLAEAMVRICFNPRVDRLISVGDLVDRGPESDLALSWLEEPWFHAVRGNHEDFAIRWSNGNMQAGHYTGNGGAWNISNQRDVQLEFASAFKAMPVAIEIETEEGLVGVVHADCPSLEWSQFTARLAMGGAVAGAAIDHAIWSRARIDYQREDLVGGVRAVVVGHTPLKEVVRLGNTIFVDTMGWRRGKFTFLDAATLEPVAAEQAEFA